MFREGSKSKQVALRLKKGENTPDIASALGVSNQLVGAVRKKLAKAEKTTRKPKRKMRRKRAAPSPSDLHIDCAIFRDGVEVLRVITTETDFVETYALALRRAKGEG